MRTSELVLFAAAAIKANGRRTAWIVLATAIGVTAVVVLAALGTGGSRYITEQFSALGTHLLIVLPGRNETTGAAPPLLGTTPRDLTIADSQALARQAPIARVAPVMIGSAPVSIAQGLEREVTVLGSTADLATIQGLALSQGQFLPALDPSRPRAVCVLGYAVREHLFASKKALGEWVRIANNRFRVVGVLSASGVTVGVNFDDTVLIPVASAQALFDRESLFRILVEATSEDATIAAETAVHRVIAARHEGEDDVSVIKQDSVVATLGRILRMVTLGVAGISALSLAVAGILIMNVMLVAVTQRRAEIGLLKAIGARSRDIRAIFITEALLLSLGGAGVGLGLGLLTAYAVALAYPNFPITVPGWAVAASLATALVSGLIFGVLPARRAAALEPVQALAKR